MTGRGVDGILRSPSVPYTPHPGSKTIEETIFYAERKNGQIPRKVDPAYIWGEAQATLAEMQPFLCIANLETAITTSSVRETKWFNFRMNPANIDTLQTLPIHCCTVANNHTLDWGRRGLLDTLDTLTAAGIAHAGAGRSYDEAWNPKFFPLPEGGRIMILGMAHSSSGIKQHWAARPSIPGIALLSDDMSRETGRLTSLVKEHKAAGDIAIASIHAGPNWSFDISPGYIRFAKELIDVAGFDVVHGHSSHHLAPINFHNGRPILFGCGDFINDYEGRDQPSIYNHSFVAAYCLNPGDLTQVIIKPFRINRFRLTKVEPSDCPRLAHMLARCSAPFGSRFSVDTKNLTIIASAN